jgi:hypothetical protein
MSTPLTVELVPSTAWYANVRTLVPARDWAVCKKVTSERAGARCEVCGGRGTRWPVECHEIWEYDDEKHIQTLVGLIALCPMCHAVKHIGRQFAIGRAHYAIMHLSKVNNWGEEDVEAYLEHCFEQHAFRSRFQWELDVSYLATLGLKVPTKPTEAPNGRTSD